MNEKRSETAKFRVTPSELCELDEKAYALGIKRTDLLRKLCLKREIILYDFAKLDKLSYEIGKIGVNINQIAKQLNQGGELHQENAEFLLAGMDLINQTLSKIYEEVLENKEENGEEN